MTQPATPSIFQRSPVCRLLRRLAEPARLLKYAKRAALGIVILLSLAFLFSSFERWRGRRAWDQAKAEAEAAGIDFHWENYIPVPVPEAENLVFSPLMKGCYVTDAPPATWPETSPLTQDVINRSLALNAWFGHWEFGQEPPEATRWQYQVRGERYVPPASVKAKKGSLGKITVFKLPPLPRDPWSDAADLIAPVQPLLALLREECLSRPRSYFPGDYSVPFASPIPAFALIRDYARLLQADAFIALHEGDATRALGDVHAMTRLAGLGEKPDFLVNVMIRTVVMRLANDVLAYGLTEEGFTEQELRAIIQLARETHPVRELGESVNTECASLVTAMRLHIAAQGGMAITGTDSSLLLGLSPLAKPWLVKLLWHLTPAEGWNWQMLARCARYPTMLSRAFHGDTVDDAAFRRAEVQMDQMGDELFDALASLAMPAYQNVLTATLSGQYELDLIAWAAAIELYRRQHSAWPASLASLDGGESVLPPRSTPTGEPYTYRRFDTGFELSAPPLDDESPITLHIGENAAQP